MAETFQLDPAFGATSVALGGLALCEARLQNDARWPWIVLIPRSPNAREIEDLHPFNRPRLMDEIVHAGRAVRAVGEALGLPVEKLNIGALGNVTPQLHVHVVGRRVGDPAWPGPVWGVGEAVPLSPEQTSAAVAAAKKALGF
ncbi:MAG: HIT domain-containing protein [Parcubacteria group bacterium]